MRLSMLLSFIPLSYAVVLSVTVTTQASNFFLVTTSQWTRASNSSQLANVSATSLFDPQQTNPYYLRLIEPGYDSLPKFNLTNGSVGSFIYGPFLQGPLDYRSAPLNSGGKLEFYPEAEMGNLTLLDGYLLATNGYAEGWQICDSEGAVEESIIAWNSSGTNCVPTFLQAVTTAPY